MNFCLIDEFPRWCIVESKQAKNNENFSGDHKNGKTAASSEMGINKPGRDPRGERGASSIEYVVLAALIIAVLVITISLVGGKTRGLFEKTEDAVEESFPR